MKEPAFEEWKVSIKKEVSGIFDILDTKLSDTPEVLRQQLVTTEGWQARVTYLLSFANYYLDKAEFSNLLTINSQRENTKEKKLTDLDREILLDEACAEERRVRDILHGFSKAMERRLTLGMCLLKRYYGEKYTNG